MPLITDPELLKELNQDSGLVTDPDLIKELEAPEPLKAQLPVVQPPIVPYIGQPDEPLQGTFEDPLNLALLATGPAFFGATLPMKLATGAALGAGYGAAQKRLETGKPITGGETLGYGLGGALTAGAFHGGGKLLEKIRTARAVAPQVAKEVVPEVIPQVAKEVIPTIEKQAIPLAEQVAQKAITPEVDPFVSAVTREISPFIPPDKAGVMSSLFQQGTLDHEVMKTVTKEAVPVLQAQGGSHDEVMNEVVEALYNSEINLKNIRPVLQGLGIDDAQFAEVFHKTGSQYGRGLNLFSQLKKKLAPQFEGTPAEDIFNQISKLGETEPDQAARAYLWVASLWRQVDNVRRASMVSQLSTAVRNAEVQIGRTPLEALDTFLQGTLRGDIKGGFNEAASQMHVLAGSSSAPQRKAIMDVLDMTRDLGKGEVKPYLLQKEKMFSTPVHEIAALDKYSKTINYFNTWQEVLSRRLAYQMRMVRHAERAGYDWTKMNWASVPEKELDKWVKDSVDFSLEATFARSPKYGSTAWHIMRLYDKAPVLTLINPYPRFNYANALRFLYDFSPIGFGQFLSKEGRAAFAAGETQKVSRAIIGSTMLATGMALRMSPWAGAKPYELNIKGSTVDTRPFAPFSTYLILGDIVADIIENGYPKKVIENPTDYILPLAIGQSRIAGTGLVFADWAGGKLKGEGFEKAVWQLAGQITSGFTVPARTLKDFIAGISPEEATMRTTKENLLAGPPLSNIPGLSQALPPLYSPFQAGEIRLQHPILKQLTGITARPDSQLRDLTINLGMSYNQIYPVTGDPKLDNQLTRYMGYIIAQNPLDINAFSNKNKDAQKDIVNKYFQAVRKGAVQMLDKSQPKLYFMYKYRNAEQEGKIKGFTDEQIKQILEQGALQYEQEHLQ